MNNRFQLFWDLCHVGIIVIKLSVVWRTKFSLVVRDWILRIPRQNSEVLGIKTGIGVRSFQGFM